MLEMKAKVGSEIHYYLGRRETPNVSKQRSDIIKLSFLKNYFDKMNRLKKIKT